MTAAYLIVSDAALDGDGRRRVKVALIQVAINVKKESFSAPATTLAWYNKRQFLADVVLEIGDSMTHQKIVQWSWFVATNAPNPLVLSDADIFSMVSANWDVMAQVSNVDKGLSP